MSIVVYHNVDKHMWSLIENDRPNSATHHTVTDRPLRTQRLNASCVCQQHLCLSMARHGAVAAAVYGLLCFNMGPNKCHSKNGCAQRRMSLLTAPFPFPKTPSNKDSSHTSSQLIPLRNLLDRGPVRAQKDRERERVTEDARRQIDCRGHCNMW